MIKLIYTTDPHGRANNPTSRKDNFPDTILKKIAYVGKLAKDENADAVVCGGDWLDRPDTSTSFVSRLAEVLSNFPCPIYSVIGNHDIYGQNPQTLPRTQLSILIAAKLIQRLYMDKPVLLADSKTKVYITGVDAHYDLDKNGRTSDYVDVPETDGVRIHVVHGFLTDRDWPNVPCTLISSVLNTKADILLTGHEHGGFGIIGRNGKLFCNPGALARVSASIGDVNQDVKVALITIQGNVFDCEFKRLPSSIALPASQVIDRAKLVEEKKHQERLTHFIDNLNDLKITDSFNVYNVLDEIATQENVPQEVVDIVRKRLEKAEEQLKEE
jgi:DNA repair exonuclease SbcCD nuclease subunit